MARARSKARRSGPTTPLLEYLSAFAGLVLTSALVLIIAWDAVTSNGGPPAVTAEVLGIAATPAGYVVEIRARNLGHAPAASVTVEGKLDGSGRAPEVAETVFDYIPERSSRDGGLIFEGDPSAGRLTLRAKGYVSP